MPNDTQDLRTHLHRFARETARLFNWTPSQHFLNLAAILARSVGPSNLDDFFALLSCEASEWNIPRREGRFFCSAFATPWGRKIVHQELAQRLEGRTIEDNAVDAEIERLSEDGLATLFSRHIARHPDKFQPRANMPPSDILWEDTILRSIDQERQQWRREAKRSRKELQEDDRALRRIDDPSSRLVAEETSLRISQFIETHLNEEDRALLLGRFGQGLSYSELASIMNVKEDAIRQRVRRMLQRIRTSLTRIVG